jgi:cytochrome c biogenesis protein CcdA
VTGLVLAFAAGLLSILSPCVLPLVPIVLGAAVSAHRLGALALAAGLASSFTILVCCWRWRVSGSASMPACFALSPPRS